MAENRIILNLPDLFKYKSLFCIHFTYISFISFQKLNRTFQLYVVTVRHTNIRKNLFTFDIMYVECLS